MHYIIYLRVSTDKQDHITQKQACLEFIANKHGLNPYTYKIFEDPNATSSKSWQSRPVFCAALNAMKKNDTFLVMRLDRMGRKAEELLSFRRIISEKKAHFLSVTQPFLHDTFSFTIFAAMAEQEVSHIRNRTKEKLKAKKTRGERTGNLPYGFQLDKTTTMKIRRGDSYVEMPYKLIPYEPELKNLKTMVNWRSQGYTYAQIVELLKQNEILNRKNNNFVVCSVFSILKSYLKNLHLLPCEGKSLQL